MYQKILLAYDGSEKGQKALIECQELAEWMKAELTLIAVMPSHIESIGVEGAFFIDEVPSRDTASYQAFLDKGLEQLSNLGYEAKGELLVGDVVREITEYAARISADLIVVGHQHETNWVRRWWGGSVTSSLVEFSPCNVLMVVRH